MSRRPPGDANRNSRRRFALTDRRQDLVSRVGGYAVARAAFKVADDLWRDTCHNKSGECWKYRL